MRKAKDMTNEELTRETLVELHTARNAAKVMFTILGVIIAGGTILFMALSH